MVIIADSGSTKTDWVGVQDGKIAFKFKTIGLNPTVGISKLALNEINAKLANLKVKHDVSKVQFFSAGCGNKRGVKIMTDFLHPIFPDAVINIEEDMSLAAKCFIETPALIGIIGTGSNSVFFDGKNMKYLFGSMGYLLMDEGSGNHYGKSLLKMYFTNKMPTDLKQKFEQKFDLSKDLVLEHLYKKERPNTYLATFMPFVIENKSHPVIKKMIEENFTLFLKERIIPFENHKEVPLHLVGSISKLLKNEFSDIAAKYGITIKEITKNPLNKYLEKILAEKI